MFVAITSKKRNIYFSKMRKYELLSPAGTFPMLVAAVEAGADAVYFGIKGLNMRAGAKNFEISDLKQIVKICEMGNAGNLNIVGEKNNAGSTNGEKKVVKKYVALNTTIYQSELKEVERLIKKLKGNADAVICSDLAVMLLCKKYEMPFHISTQASISNAESAKFYGNLGAERIVLARELSLSQISEIAKKISPLEIECFCHGAMCVSESGRCFTSQFLCEKSANRGECVQPCRRAYKITDVEDGHELILQNNRVMSAKDLCALPFINEMKRAGISSFKIEGRNRTPEYVSAVTKVYRNALDNELTQGELEEGLEELKKVYNRGFSSGFYIKKPTAEDFSKSDFGEQTEKKTFLGKVVKYWPKLEVAALKLNFGKLKVGDEIYIIGNATGVARIKVDSMQIDLNPVLEVCKGQEVGIKVPKCRVGDEVYLIEKK